MDSALMLKIAYDKGEQLSELEIDQMLKESDVIKRLTEPITYKALSPIWRIIALSEIPFSSRLDYTKHLIEYVDRNFATEVGFSITGKSDDLLPCYNAMLVEGMVKFGESERPSVQNAVSWIKKYQVFDRSSETTWKGSGIKKYGGCMNETPCYIGIAKSVKALLHYDLGTNAKDPRIKEMIDRGTTYILSHNLYQRLTNGEPITKHILEIAYPPSYHLNILELLEIAYLTGNMQHESVKTAIDYVISKKVQGQYWKINSVYKAEGYLSFDTRGKAGDWVSYLLDKYLGEDV